jgi:DNA-binding LytR/AlgR family response regulator
MKIKCAIVDDEPIAARGIEKYAKEISNLEVVGVFESAIELNEYIENNQVDLVFLDINMPLISGIEWVKSTRNPPKIIFTTAYNEYALEGFELNVIDYLLKPISFARFLKAANKAAAIFKDGSSKDFIFIKTEGKLEKLLFDEILYIQGMQNYVTFHTPAENHICHLTLKAVVQQLPQTNFLQVHKSYVVNLAHIKSLDKTRITLGDDIFLPIGNTWKEEVIARITDQNVLKK